GRGLRTGRHLELPGDAGVRPRHADSHRLPADERRHLPRRPRPHRPVPQPLLQDLTRRGAPGGFYARGMPDWTLPNFRADLRGELEAGMEEHRAEVEAIATGPWPPTFADTIEALERAGQRLQLAAAPRRRGL